MKHTLLITLIMFGHCFIRASENRIVTCINKCTPEAVCFVAGVGIGTIISVQPKPAIEASVIAAGIQTCTEHSRCAKSINEKYGDPLNKCCIPFTLGLDVAALPGPTEKCIAQSVGPCVCSLAAGALIWQDKNKDNLA